MEQRNRWLSIQGVPSDAPPGLPSRYPSDSQVQLDPYTVTVAPSAAILPTIIFRNTEAVDVFADAYLEVTGGTPGDHLTVAFQLDDEVWRRTSDVILPIPVAGFVSREGVNIADHLGHVPVGTHTLKFWAASPSGNPVTVAARALQFVSFPVDNGQNGARFVELSESGPTVVASSQEPAVLPHSQSGLPAGYWYAVTPEITMPNSPVGNLNWTGSGYIELLGRTGAWANVRAEMMVETYHTTNNGEQVTDMMWVPITVPAGPGHIYFFTEAFNYDNHYDNKIRIWMRKAWPGSDETFTVGRVYAAMKLVPMTNAHCTYDGSGTPPPAVSVTRLYTLTPCRILDTRYSTPVAANTFRNVQVSGACGVPDTAKASAINVTAVRPASSGTLRLYETGIWLPLIVSTAYRANKVRATGTIVGLSSYGSVTLYNDGSVPVDVILDVTGYFR